MMVKMQGKGHPHSSLMGLQASVATRDISVEAQKKIKVDLPCDLSIPLLDICLSITCSAILTATGFLIAWKRKQPKCHPNNKWIMKIESTSPVELYSK